MRRFFMLICLAVFALGSFACAGPPPLAEIENNLKSPSATLTGPQIKVAYHNYFHGQTALTMPGLSKYGQAVSFLKADVKVPNSAAPGLASKVTQKTPSLKAKKMVPMRDYLTRAGIPSKVADILMPYLPVNNDLSKRQLVHGDDQFGVLQQQLPVNFKVGCIEGSANAGVGSGSFRVKVDLGCQGEGSGTVEIKAIAESGDNSANLRFEIRFGNACDKNGNCVDGGMIYKFDAEASGGNANGSMLMSMLIRAKSASGESAEVKQGMRIYFDTARKAGSIDVLVYVRDEDNREGTVVLQIKREGDTGSFSAKGANGVYTCSTTDRGKTGKCFAENSQGSASYEW